MTEPDLIFSPKALERAVPRYTSYPTAPHFTPEIGAERYGAWLDGLAPEAPLSLYLHVPFCDDLCWFCACRTQGTRSYAPVERYLGLLAREIEIVAARLGTERAVRHVHWGGGSPTVLSPADLSRLHGLLVAAFPGAAEAEFAVEIDPRDVTEAKLDALAEAGLGRASIGVQDFDETVQTAIGRRQGRALTAEVVEGLRARGVRGVNIDLLYGLPFQSVESLARTVRDVIELEPDRLALFGYAHVPWMAKRQKMIPEGSLPGIEARRAQARLAREQLVAAGYEAIGIDHFAKPHDALAVAARAGTMRRNFQGYTVDEGAALIGMGASAISALPAGYAQNDPITASYQLRIEAGRLPVVKGVAVESEDQIRREAIEEILCGLSLDLDGLSARHGSARTAPVAEIAGRLLAAAPAGALSPWRGGFRIAPGWRDHVRLIAAEFDRHLAGGTARHSAAV